jgi:hypothetical protein
VHFCLSLLPDSQLSSSCLVSRFPPVSVPTKGVTICHPGSSGPKAVNSYEHVQTSVLGHGLSLSKLHHAPVGLVKTTALRVVTAPPLSRPPFHRIFTPIVPIANRQLLLAARAPPPRAHSEARGMPKTRKPVNPKTENRKLLLSARAPTRTPTQPPVGCLKPYNTKTLNPKTKSSSLQLAPPPPRPIRSPWGAGATTRRAWSAGRTG